MGMLCLFPLSHSVWSAWIEMIEEYIENYEKSKGVIHIQGQHV